MNVPYVPLGSRHLVPLPRRFSHRKRTAAMLTLLHVNVSARPILILRQSSPVECDLHPEGRETAVREVVGASETPLQPATT